MLGVMYEMGQGVSQDHTEAIKWHRKAAEQGHTMAQYSLGIMYVNGRGVLQDDVQAYAWLNIFLAQETGGFREIAKNFRDRTAEFMTREERALAQELSRAYWDAYVVPFRN